MHLLQIFLSVPSMHFSVDLLFPFQFLHVYFYSFHFSACLCMWRVCSHVLEVYVCGGQGLTLKVFFASGASLIGPGISCLSSLHAGIVGRLPQFIRVPGI